MIVGISQKKRGIPWVGGRVANISAGRIAGQQSPGRMSFVMAVTLISTPTSMSRKQSYGEGWLDGECYWVKYFKYSIYNMNCIGRGFSSRPT
ncbi:hypothetical protein RchiOBHm_Chr5g0061411 [Rosa chinensis]|uniref:Uncharacterized protein n=1 Tax=Rosa chinensis TaxID=74649 RepID=A0A2P6QHW6_ROSCH|nr:hypothetical protein RchiOBHm_Chr5g0061411 [Rosa chinensis]